MNEDEKKPAAGPLGPPLLENTEDQDSPDSDTAAETSLTQEATTTPEGYAKAPESKITPTEEPANEPNTQPASEPGSVVGAPSNAPVATTQNDKNKNSAVLPIVVAILTVVLLIAIGVAAIRLSDTSQNTEDDQTQAQPVDENELDQQSAEVDQIEQDLQEVEQDLETNDITDENVGL